MTQNAQISVYNYLGGEYDDRSLGLSHSEEAIEKDEHLILQYEDFVHQNYIRMVLNWLGVLPKHHSSILQCGVHELEDVGNDNYNNYH